MNLAEILALIPDNESGEIDATDLRTVVTALYNQPKLSFFTRWVYNTTPNISPPSQGITFETADLLTAAWVRFSNTSKDGYDMDAALHRQVEGARLHFQDTNDDSRWVRAELNAPAISVASAPPCTQLSYDVLAAGEGTGFTGDMIVLFGVIPAV